jgi:hypothetical protein
VFASGFVRDYPAKTQAGQSFIRVNPKQMPNKSCFNCQKHLFFAFNALIVNVLKGVVQPLATPNNQ